MASAEKPFARYWHRPLTSLDVLAFRVGAQLHNRIIPPPHPREDLELFRRLLFTRAADTLKSPKWQRAGLLPRNGIADPGLPLWHDAFDLLQRYFFEINDPATAVWIEGQRPPIAMTDIVYAPNRLPQPQKLTGQELKLYAAIREHIDGGIASVSKKLTQKQRARAYKLEQQTTSIQAAGFLYDGGALKPGIAQDRDRTSVASNSSLQRHYRARKQHYIPMHYGRDGEPLGFTVLRSFNGNRRRLIATATADIIDEDPADVPYRHNLLHRLGSRRRAISEPPDIRRFHAADMSGRSLSYNDMAVIFPELPLSKLLSRTRSRSLSPSGIDAFFPGPNPVRNTGQTPGGRETGFGNPLRLLPWYGSDDPTVLCGNCASNFHETSECEAPCGYCGGSSHNAPSCTSSRGRCKCVLFPQFHLADACPVLCSRPCGNNTTRGQRGHRNAMTCKSRCCMCGEAGHRGKNCVISRCRCGGPHLGQDCGWNPVCRVVGCGRYVCWVHCVACGGSGMGKLEGGKCRECGAVEERVPRGRQREKTAVDVGTEETSTAMMTPGSSGDSEAATGADTWGTGIPDYPTATGSVLTTGGGSIFGGNPSLDD